MSQSGALGIAILALAAQKQLGLSHFVSVGNKADVSGNDLLQYWEQDPTVNTILLYLESFGNPRRFSRIARHVARTKPIVAVKSGRTTAGQRAAGSHTAALAASDVAVDALFHQAGVIRAETLEELFDLTALLFSQPLPKGRSVAIVTNAGGPGILCADACETKGLRVAELAPETAVALAQALPKAASVSNPIDMIASATPDHFRQTITTVLSAAEVDALVVIYIPVGVVQTAHILEGIQAGIREGRATGGAGKPILACLMGENGMPQPLEVDQERIPTYLFPESPALVLGKVTDYATWRTQPPGSVLDFDDVHPARAREMCRKALEARGPGWLSMQEAWEVLSAMGLPMAGGCAATADEAAALARSIGFPVAVKLASRTIIHKTEHEAVRLNRPDEPAVREAFESIRQQLIRAGTPEAMDGVVVQPMVTGAVEVMVGVTCDPSFGPIIAFGLGGSYVEVLRDVVFRITPLTDRDAREMIRAIRGFRLLEGYRGHPAADLDALEEVLLRVSLLTEAVPLITELDLNPIFALPPGQGCRLVDARIWVGPAKV
jgi:acyl-CoA synthetase (NDP forming)